MTRIPRILVACEFSGIVREAFRRRGFDAVSCDLLPTDIPGPHYQGDVRDILDGSWDLLIAHDPCTYRCNSGVRWLHEIPGRWDQLRESCEFTNLLLQSKIPRICRENPIPHKYALELIGTDYTQMVQPHYFGDRESKATCLWLVNLPKLKRTHWITDGIQQSVHRCPPSDDRSKIRSRTFPGLAEAMASQWGPLL